MVRFGMWDELLAEAAPDAKLAALTAGYRYARATALAAKGRVDEAKAELAELEKLAAAATADDSAGLNSAADVLAVAVLVGKARIAQSQQARRRGDCVADRGGDQGRPAGV